MPDITLSYSQEELEDFVRKMLATKGLQPKNDQIEFRPHTLNGEVKDFVVVIQCEPGPMLDECPMCQTKLSTEAPAPPKPKVFRRNAVPKGHPASAPVLVEEDEAEAEAYVEAAQAAERDYPVDGETQEEQDPAVIDPELGETFDPPSPGEGAASVSVSKPVEEDQAEMGGSMKSLLAQNRRLTAQKERELAERKRAGGGPASMGAGESTRPPKPGEGS